jgi:hypothetical protein
MIFRMLFFIKKSFKMLCESRPMLTHSLFKIHYCTVGAVHWPRDRGGGEGKLLRRPYLTRHVGWLMPLELGSPSVGWELQQLGGDPVLLTGVTASEHRRWTRPWRRVLALVVRGGRGARVPHDAVTSRPTATWQERHGERAAILCQHNKH